MSETLRTARVLEKVGVALAVGLSGVVVAGCVSDASCSTKGAEELLRATSVVAERVSVRFDHLADYDCDSGGRRFVVLNLVHAPGSLAELEDICTSEGGRYSCKIDELDFYVRSNDPGFPDDFETFEVQLS